MVGVVECGVTRGCLGVLSWISMVIGSSMMRLVRSISSFRFYFRDWFLEVVVYYLGIEEIRVGCEDRWV